MSLRKKPLLVPGFVLLALVLVRFVMPPLMEHSIAAWLRYEARRSGLVLDFSEIHAPLFHPLEIRELKIVGAGLDAEHFEFDAGRVEAGLSFAAFFGGSEKSHLLSSLLIEHAKFFIRGRAPLSAGPIDWTALARLLPERFEIFADQLRLEQPFSLLLFQDTKVSASKGNSGILSIGAVEMRAPFLEKHFAHVRGMTRWQDDRLSIGSINLLEGLTIDSLVIDLTGLRTGRVGTDLGVSVLGGKMRANIATERPGKTRLWDAAGTASGISLPQLASALGFTVPVQGMVRASKFTFRGDPRDFLNATASIWTELTGFSWRERKADVIMLGANFYGHTVQLQQLFIKQRRNELTLSGETAIGTEWLNPDFRGDISASINDLGQFAELFGASPEAFAGKVAARGRMHAHERTVDGDLALTGDALKIFRLPVDSLTARIGLESGRAQVDQLELKRGEDFLRAQGKIDLAQKKSFTLSAESWCHELRDYALEFPIIGTLSGALSTKLTGAGDESSFSSTVSGQTNQFSFSAQTNWRSDAIAINSLKINLSDTAAAELKGTIDLTDPKHFRANLSSANELRCDGPLADKGCAHGLELHEGETGLPFSEIALDGRDLTLRQSSPTAIAQSIKLCDEGEPGQPVQINIPRRLEPPPPSSPSPAPLPSPAPPPP
ncbi:MAG: hypothetical protein DME43_12935 [Verrucomicrobia bacterium]|nr:MAG: hypothetical protein DME43_12935 [Verrucomicrobiota bacterium]